MGLLNNRLKEDIDKLNHKLNKVLFNLNKTFRCDFEVSNDHPYDFGSDYSMERIHQQVVHNAGDIGSVENIRDLNNSIRNIKKQLVEIRGEKGGCQALSPGQIWFDKEVGNYFEITYVGQIEFGFKELHNGKLNQLAQYKNKCKFNNSILIKDVENRHDRTIVDG